MGDMAKRLKRRLRRDSGITMIETLMAAAILVIGSIGMLSLIIASIATNNRNKMDSTQTMLAQSILEQVASTFTPNNGPGTSSLVDCAGNTWTIDTTTTGSTDTGSALSGSSVDYSETSPPALWHMNYVMATSCNATPTVIASCLDSTGMNYTTTTTPCSATGSTGLGTYDVRWHLMKLGSTQTYLITVSAKLKGHGEGNQYFSLPVTLRVMLGS